MDKATLYQEMMDAFDLYNSSSDDTPNPDLSNLDLNKTTNLISKSFSDFDTNNAKDGQIFAARLAQAIIAAVTEGISSSGL